MSRRSELVLALVLGGCTITSDPMLQPRDAGPIDASTDAPGVDGGFTCSPGRTGCFGNVHYRCGDDGRSRQDETECAEACDPLLACVACVPGSRRCDGTVSLVCDDDGAGYRVGRDCADWGSTCGASGACDDACAAAEAERSYVGCEYWPAPLANYWNIEDLGFDFRIVVANPSAALAEVTITRGTRLVAVETVPPGAAVDIALPWIDEVTFAFSDEEDASHVATSGAYRVISSQPVVVTQFNPFHYSYRGRNSFSNDASLLLPAHVLGTEHVGLSYVPLSIEGGGAIPGYLAIVGTSAEGAEVDVTVTADVSADAGGRWEAARAGETIHFSLARGDVAQIAPALPPACDATRPGYRPLPEGGAFCDEPAFDLTGSRIVSSRPVEVFGGHVCANVPVDVTACDHLETTLAPVTTWGTRFETAPLRDPTTDVGNLLRIVAAHDGTTITVTPPVRGIDPGLVLDAGEHVDALIEGAVSIAASRPIEVGQLLLGQDVTEPALERGDPGLTTLVPREQFRIDYVFITPTSYAEPVNGQSWVLVSRAPGVALVLDGEPVVATWTTVGDRELATVAVPGGAHRATSNEPFGLVAFGLGEYTSYAYPAGLDLRIVPD